MKKIYIIIIVIIVLIIILGFVIAAFISESTICTKMGCPCRGIEGERPCNSCTISNYIFVSRVINIANVCDATEIITCENDLQVDKRFEKSDCKYELRFFFQGI